MHGNPRIVNGEVDIGCDEIDELLVAGSYGNDTKSHFNPWNSNLGNEAGFNSPIVPTGLGERSHITRAQQLPIVFAFTADSSLLIAATPGAGTVPAWTHMPGSLPLAVVVPPTLWLDISSYPLGTIPLSNFQIKTWPNWQSTQVHTFGEELFFADDQPAGTPFPPSMTSYLNGQLLYLDTATSTLKLSNLQSEYY